MQSYSATTEGEEAVPTTKETLLQLRGATAVKAVIDWFSFSADSTSATAEPVLVRLVRQTTDGTATGATEVKGDPDDPTANCTAFHTFTSTEPTDGDVIMEHLVYPGGIPLVVQFPLGKEPKLQAATTSRIAVTVLAPAAVNCVAGIGWTEGG